MKNPFCIYAPVFAPLFISSPGIALHQEAVSATSPISAASGEPSIEVKNVILRAREDVYDRVIQSMPGYGSGANSTLDRVWYEAASLSPLREMPESRIPQNVADVVAEIRSTLSLQVKELAEVLGVERPTVYAWLRGNAKPQSTNRARLREVLKVVAVWNRLSDLPLGSAIRDDLGEDGRTLVDELSESKLDLRLVERRMKQLHQKSVAEKQEAKSILDIAREQGIEMTNVRDNQDIIDVLTGKRSHED